MKTRYVVDNDKVRMQETARAKSRNEILGATQIPAKPNGNVSRYMRKRSLTKGVRSGKMRTMKFDTSLPSWGEFARKEISFAELQAKQANGD